MMYIRREEMDTAIIKKITIKNFRSIEKIEFNPKSMSIFVGSNDVGKSNILRALNLFFNNQTDYDTFFDFTNDFTKTANTSKKAKEIVISLEIFPPSNYTFVGKYIIWTKKWRIDGWVDETITDQDKNELPNRSKVPAWLRKIKYRYVPAIKGNEFFSKLLSDLHDTLAYVNEAKFHNALKTFMKEVQKQTQDISETLLEHLNVQSSISVPSDLKQLFSTLDFETKINKDFTVSLNQRGDGIKTRHIPVILNFMAENEGFAKSKGAISSHTIWGYEEPENNLEMSKAFELAKSFIEYEENAQIFLTTHSPAFYLLEKDSDDCNIFYVQQSNNSTELTKIKDYGSIHDDMGMMPLIAPFIQEKINAISKLEESNSQLTLLLKRTTKPVLYVEGKTDKTILEIAWDKLFPSTTIPVEIIDSGGHPSIKSLFNSGALPAQKLIIGLMDFDEAFGSYDNVWQKQHTIFDNSIENGLTKKHKDYPRYLSLLPVPNNRKTIASTDLKSSSKLSIEFLFSDEIIKNFISERTSVGGGKYFDFTGDKVKFAESVKTFSNEYFQNIEQVFKQITAIINDYSESTK